MAEQPATVEQTQTSGAPVRIDPAVLAGRGLDPGPEQDGIQSAAKSVFEGDIVSAVYESGPGTLQVDGLPYDEFIYILAGELVLTGADDGVAHTFRTGDHLVLPKGWTGTWQMLGDPYRELIVVETQTYLQSLKDLGIDL